MAASTRCACHEARSPALEGAIKKIIPYLAGAAIFGPIIAGVGAILAVPLLTIDSVPRQDHEPVVLASQRCGMDGLYRLDAVMASLSNSERRELVDMLSGEGIYVECGGLGGCVYTMRDFRDSRCLP